VRTVFTAGLVPAAAFGRALLAHQLFTEGLFAKGLFAKGLFPVPVPGNPAFRPHGNGHVDHAAGREDGRIVQVHDHSEDSSNTHGGDTRHNVQPPESQHE
jgi:hypothetical protein